MKQFTLKSLMLLLLLLIGGGSYAWGETKTGTIKFGTNNLKISSANVTGNDNLNNSWNIVTTGTTSFPQQSDCARFGSSDYPAKTITFTMTLPSDVKFTSFSANFGGFKGTKGNISLTIDGTKVGSGSLSATKDVVVGGELKTATTGKELKVTVTNIAKGVKCYNISYTYEDSSDSPALNVNTTSVDFGKVVAGASVEPKNVTVTMANIEGGATAKLDKGEASPFAVTPESLSATGDVAVSPKAETLAAAGVYEDKLTITAGELTKTVDVKLTIAKKSIVTWNVNGKDYIEGNPTTEVVEGEKVEALPTTPASVGGLVFMGWTNEAVTSQEAAPDVLFTSAADAPAVTSDVTYYAVFAIQSGSMKWKKVSLANVDEGIYALITPDGHAFNGEIEKAGHGKATADAFVFDKDVATSAPEGTLEIILSAKAGGYTMFNADKGYLYARDAKSGNLAWGTKESSNWHYKEGKEGKEDNWLCSNNAYLRCYENTFRTYGSGIYDSISFVKKVSDISYSNYTTTAETLPLRAFDGKNYFATFSSDKAVKFVDATVFTVDVENGTISLNEIASKQVPANTGVLLRSTKESDVFTYIESAPAIEGTNLLKPASEQMTEGFKFYKLAYDNYTEKTGLGFYWGAAEGGAFTVKPGLAYLAVPQAQAANVKGFSFDGTQTGINGVEATTAKGAIYNLNGQRVEKAQRGIYIQNGKKFIVK